ncbi:hypothetical protein [Phenylobacterium montanum]|uniref:Uncharacterized protein n=1 Tax=Phenylobacterium montanum TaxID=2823693 RepID=A0A975IVX2_9CAUL|nr:hypothetical protein [Caulobacter sp. S6]QUD87781.1 hypothetical protein KCG34_22495 [Caulobacter sp. S6]
MTVYDRRFRLADGSGALGLSFGPDGLSLAGVPLLRTTVSGLAPRPAGELDVLIKGAYGRELDVAGLSAGLRVVAEALNCGHEPRAMIAALQLRLTELDWRGAVRIATVEDALAKYSPEQPRDWRGRWTDGGDAGPTPGETGTPQADNAPASPTSSWGVGPVHLEGGRLIPIQGGNGGIGGNGPPPDPFEVQPAEPVYTVQHPPIGTEPDRRIVGGLEYPVWRSAKLSDGSKWPVATVSSIRAAINSMPGRTPQLRIYVPTNGYGDILLGSTPNMDLPERPEGYDEVLLRGRPQVTSSRGLETGHADDGVEEALRLARSNEFKEICFNLSFTNCTGMVVQSVRRPDVLAIVRPQLDVGYNFRPYETWSPRQKPEERQEEMPDVPGIRRLNDFTNRVALAEFMRMRDMAKAFRSCS